MNAGYERWRHRTLQSYRESLASTHLAFGRTKGRLNGDTDHDQVVLSELEIIGSMASDITWVMEYLRSGKPPAVEERPARLMYVADIPPTARPVLPAGAGSIRGPLAEALTALPQRQREVLMLVEGQGLSPTEVASMLNIKRQSVEVHLARARERLMPFLDRAGRQRRQDQETKARQMLI